MFVLLSIQIVLAVVFWIYGLLLVIRRDRKLFYFLFFLVNWALGAMHVLPTRPINPSINQVMIILSQVGIIAMLFIHRSALNDRRIR